MQQGFKYWISYTLFSPHNRTLLPKSQEIITTFEIETVDQLNSLSTHISNQIVIGADGKLPEDVRVIFSSWPHLLEIVQDYSTEVHQPNTTPSKTKPVLSIVKTDD